MFERCARRSGAVGALTALAACSVALAGDPTPLTTELFTDGLQRPVYLVSPPGDTERVFIIERPGRIRIADMDGNLEVLPFLDIDAKVFGGVQANDEHGLLGMAFHPNYDENGFFYVNYTANSDAQGTEDTIIERYTVSSDPNLANPNSDFLLLDINQPFGNHNAGWLGFGPNDGFLYIPMGDGGSACDPGQNAQNLNNLLGAILRIDVDNQDPGLNYAIPADNPFVDEPGRDEIWAYGLRNPFRSSFDRATGDLYLGDVGQDSQEEVDFQPLDSQGGENYGWDCREGDGCSSCVQVGCDCADPTLVDPVFSYSHFGGPFVCSVIGGYVYRGCAIPDLQGTYFTADFCSSQIWSFQVVNGEAVNVQERQGELDPPGADSINSIVSFGEDALGEMYILENNPPGQIWKIVAEDGTNGCPEPCEADCNDDGEANVLDFVCFQTLFAAMDPAADCNGDGQLNILDFTCFQAAFAACQ